MECLACATLCYKKQWSGPQWSAGKQFVVGADGWKRNCCKACDPQGWNFSHHCEEKMLSFVKSANSLEADFVRRMLSPSYLQAPPSSRPPVPMSGTFLNGGCAPGGVASATAATQSSFPLQSSDSHWLNTMKMRLLPAVGGNLRACGLNSIRNCGTLIGSIVLN